MALPTTSLTLLSRLRNEGDARGWEVSWKRFLELYHGPLLAIARSIYRKHTNGGEPSSEFLEDVVAQVVVDFFKKDQFDADRGRLRTFLRVLVNARVVDALRKERPLDHESMATEVDPIGEFVPDESDAEAAQFHQALLATLIEDLREKIPLRQFEIFEMVKLRDLPAETVAAELGVARGVIDNTIYKVMKRLRELSASPEYQEEFFR